MKDYYEILEVMPDASLDVIKAAYRTLVKRMHPDNGGVDNVEKKTIEDINEAYEVLSDSKKRAEYDRKRKADTCSQNDTIDKDIYAEEDEDDKNARTKIINIIISLIVWIIVQFLDIPRWFEITVAVVLIFVISDCVSLYILRYVDTLDIIKNKWEEEDDNTLESLLFFVGLQILFRSYNISNWLTKICSILLIMDLILLVMKIREMIDKNT